MINVNTAVKSNNIKLNRIRGLKALKRGMITGMEFVYMNAPFDVFYIVKRTVNKEIEDETSVFGELLQCFLKNQLDGVTEERDLKILETLEANKAELVTLVKIAAEYNCDAQGYFHEMQRAQGGYAYYLSALLGAQIRLRMLIAKKDWVLANAQKGYVISYLDKLSKCKAVYRAMLAA